MKRKRVSVFVVDDDPIIALILGTIMHSRGFQVEHFVNPLQALESAKSSPPNLLISDIQMPELSGMDLAIQVQAVHPACKVLLVSGHALDIEHLRKTTRGWHDDFQILFKPIQPRELLQAIRDQGIEVGKG